MQDPAVRSRNAVCGLLGVPEPTMRKWTRMHGWNERIVAGGEKHDALATVLYRALYDRAFGDADLVVIHPKMRVPYPRIVTSLPPPSEPSASIQTRADEARTEKREARKKIGTVIDASLGVFVKALKDNRVRVSMSDLPILLRLKREYLNELEDDIPDDLAGSSDYELRALIADVLRSNGLEDEAALAIKLVAG